MSLISLDSKEVQYLAERDYRLRHLMLRIGNLEYNRSETAFRNLAHSIIEQMLSMKVGQVIEDRLADLCDGELSPEKVRALDVVEIKACGMSLRKAQSLQSLAVYALSNDLEALAEFSDEEVCKTLLQLPGIGKWTCDMFLLFYLERPDILPVEDGALKQSFEWLYEAPIMNKDVQRAVCSLWRPYSSIAVRYLYRALNTGLVKDILPAEKLWTQAAPINLNSKA